MAGAGTNGRRRQLPEFPPKWVPRTMRAVYKAISWAALAAAAYAAAVAGTLAYERFQAGRLPALPAPLAALARQQAVTVTLPAAHAAAAAGALALLAWAAARAGRRRAVYLLDFECYRGPDELKVTYERFLRGSRDLGFDADAMAFQTKILHKSGLSQETFVPPSLHATPHEATMGRAREEAELVMFGAVRALLSKAGVHPSEVGVLVVNCSLFNPTPSLSAMIINHFKMRPDVDSYNLGGMGCSAGIIAVGLAAKLLRERRAPGVALVVSTENMTMNWYPGSERSMLIPNIIFRMGAAASLLSTRADHGRRAKYALEHCVRVHLGADDAAFRAVYQRPDAAGKVGVELSKDLVSVAARAMERNLGRLGPLVLPASEKAAFAANWVARRLLRARVAPYVPDFGAAFDHFCLHAGGRGVVEGLSAQLGLSDAQMAPSANTMHWYGNTSSSTVWYSLAYAETAQGVRAGDRAWQIGFGSGFKCNSAVWRALRPIRETHAAWRHVAGREGEALALFRKIAAETAAERAAKEAAGASGAANGAKN